MRWWLPPCLLLTLLATGELWLRVLVAEAVAPAARFGLGAICGLVSLPLVALVLQLLSVPVRAVPITAGLALLAVLLSGVALLRERSGRVPEDPRFARTLAAIAIPAVVTAVIGVRLLWRTCGCRTRPSPATPAWPSAAGRPTSPARWCSRGPASTCRSGSAAAANRARWRNSGSRSATGPPPSRSR
ncbi:hypothetical protein [Paractinoplanes durhamensis]|uniref:hypothetical protein n=1 Tax=Paractinoplanes durhamensis TaxID=113563 RepID=UPI003636F387